MTPPIRLSLAPRRSALLQGHDCELDVLVRLVAPDAPAELPVRAPLNLAIVLDRSGSMGGRPLAEAKRCAAFMAAGLSERDRVAVVTFDDTVRVICPSGPAGADHRASVNAALKAVEAGGSTALHAGWLAGGEQAAAHARPGTVSRVLLLTDGQANAGLTDPAAIAADAARLAEAGVSTSTYGLGSRFDEDLLAGMARRGLGQAYYGESADDLMDPFREEFDLLSALVARSVRLRIDCAPGVRGEVLNLYMTDAEGRSVLPDLAYGGVAWALVRLRVPASLAEAGRPDLHVLTAHASYETLAGERRLCEPAHLRLERMPAQAFESLAEDQEVRARAQELRAATLQEQARTAAYQGDWAGVTAALEAARAEAGDNQWVAETVRALETFAAAGDAARFGKEARLKAARMRSRLSQAGEGADWSAALEHDKASYLRRKRQQGKAFFNPEPGGDA